MFFCEYESKSYDCSSQKFRVLTHTGTSTNTTLLSTTFRVQAESVDVASLGPRHGGNYFSLDFTGKRWLETTHLMLLAQAQRHMQTKIMGLLVFFILYFINTH